VIPPEEAEEGSFPDTADFLDVIQAQVPDGFSGMEKPQKALAIDFNHPFTGNHKKSVFLKPKNLGKYPQDFKQQPDRQDGTGYYQIGVYFQRQCFVIR
jgi:hypothetical protein